MDRWILRDEILKSLTKWYLILAAILVGALVGFGISYLKPAPYQAVGDIYIGIDVKRVNEMEYVIPLAEEEPLNLDDYKNWQLKQVADILTSNDVLQAALKNLQLEDPYWNGMTVDDFKKDVDIYWYDTGTWKLRVTLPEKKYAAAAVEEWINSGYERLSELIDYSQEQSYLDQQIWSINLAIKDLKVKRAQLKAFQDDCQEWITRFGEQPVGEVISTEDYTELTDLVSVYGDGSELWQDLLKGVPGKDQPVSDFTDWLDNANHVAGITVSELEDQMTVLNQEREDLLPVYHEYLDDSLGLSANLVLQPNTSTTQVKQIYNSSDFILGGAFLGLIAWLLAAAVRIKGIEDKNG